MPVSIRDVAARAGVSQATVSKVLNSKTQSEIALQTQERVRRAAREMGYHPRIVARGLTGKPMNTIGVVMAYNLPSVTADPYLGPLLDGVIAVNKLRRQKTVLFVEDDWHAACGNLPVYCDGSCDGLLLFAPSNDSHILAELQRSHVRYVLIGNSRLHPGITVVDVDNVALADKMVTYLLERGHRRIAALCGNADFTSDEQRTRGYLQALTRHGLISDPALVVPGEYWEWSGYESARWLMRLPRDKRPSALFCGDQRIGVGALYALRELSIQVPGEVSVAALGDYPPALATDPPLTTIPFPLRDVGTQAVEMLLMQVHEGAAAGERVLLTAQIVERGSVAPLESGGR